MLWKSFHLEDNLLRWKSEFITVMLWEKFVGYMIFLSHKNCSIWATFIGVMKIHQCDENSTMWWDLSKFWKLIDVMIDNKFYRTYQCWWKSKTWKIDFQFDENSLMWWKFTRVMRIYHFDEISPLGRNLITKMKIHHCFVNTADKIHLCDKKSSLWRKFSI